MTLTGTPETHRDITDAAYTITLTLTKAQREQLAARVLYRLRCEPSLLARITGAAARQGPGTDDARARTLARLGAVLAEEAALELTGEQADTLVEQVEDLATEPGRCATSHLVGDPYAQDVEPGVSGDYCGDCIASGRVAS